MTLQDGGHLPGEEPAAVDTDVIADEVDFLHPGHVGSDDLRVIGDDGAVVVIVAELFVDVVTHAGIEDRLRALCDQVIHMSVDQFGREAHGIRGNGGLAGEIQIARGEGRHDNVKAERREEGMPEGQKLIHIQAHRKPDLPARSISAARLHQRSQAFLLV